MITQIDNSEPWRRLVWPSVGRTTPYKAGRQQSIADSIPITVEFSYKPTDPFAINAVFAGIKWLLSRDLIHDVIAGTVSNTAGQDVNITVDNSWTRFDLSSPTGSAAVWVDSEQLAEFLFTTYVLVPAGVETTLIDWDHELAALLGGAWS